MTEQHIKFNKQRDFEQLIACTFDFVKQELKPLLKAILTYAGPFVLITAFLMVKYQASIQIATKSNPLIITDNTFSTTYFLLVLSSVISNVVLTLTVYVYIKLYIKKGKDNFEIEEIWQLTIKKFSSILLALTVMGFMIAIGVVAFVVPGIYLAIILSMVLPIMIFEDQDFNKAVKYSINLIKDYWWFSFALLIVIYFISFIAGFVFSLPQLLVSNNQGTPQTINTLLSVFGAFSSIILFALPNVTIAFYYFNLIEKRK